MIKERTTIEVRQEDIDKGICRTICACPIALALKRVYTGHRDDYISVLPYYTRFGNNPIYYDHYRLPNSAIEFIRDFDNGRHVVPLSFEFDGPEITTDATI